ncbi:unnamed protein product, partial [Symbiodinium necroappetens]
MTGRCAKLEVPIDMVNVPIKPERGMQKKIMKVYMYETPPRSGQFAQRYEEIGN